MKILNGEIISSGITMGAIYFKSKATDIEELIENRNKEISSDDLQSE